MMQAGKDDSNMPGDAGKMQRGQEKKTKVRGSMNVGNDVLKAPSRNARNTRLICSKSGYRSRRKGDTTALTQRPGRAVIL
jgi:hypothetical protein